MAWVHDFEDHVVAGFQSFNDGIELIFGAGWMFVNADDDEARLETGEVGEGATAHRLNDNAGCVDPGCRLVGNLANDQAEFFPGFGGIVRGICGLLAGHFSEDLVAVADSDGGIARFSVADKSETNA